MEGKLIERESKGFQKRNKNIREKKERAQT